MGDPIREFAGIRGVCSQDTWGSPQFYLAHTLPEFLSQAVRELGISRGGNKLSRNERWRMWQFHDTHRDERRFSALLRELAFTRSLMILKQEEEREFYLRLAGGRK